VLEILGSSDGVGRKVDFGGGEGEGGVVGRVGGTEISQEVDPQDRMGLTYSKASKIPISLSIGHNARRSRSLPRYH